MQFQSCNGVPKQLYLLWLTKERTCRKATKIVRACQNVLYFFPRPGLPGGLEMPSAKHAGRLTATLFFQEPIYYFIKVLFEFLKMLTGTGPVKGSMYLLHITFPVKKDSGGKRFYRGYLGQRFFSPQ